MARKTADAAPKWNNKVHPVILERVAKATIGGSFTYESKDDCAVLLKDGLVEMNETMPGDTEGTFATRATTDGIKYIGLDKPADGGTEDKGSDMSEATSVPAGVTNTVATRAPRNPISVANAVSGIAAGLPEKPKGATRGRKSQYKFDTLAAPNGGNYAFFFIPNEDGRKDMKKLVQGNVASQNKKVAGTVDQATGKAPKFEAFDYEHEGKVGVAVFRVE